MWNKLTTTRLTSVLLCAAALGANIAFAGEPPRSMRNLVLNPKHRTSEPTRLGGQEWEMLRVFSELPTLIWPVDSAAAPFEQDREAARAFLQANAAALGCEGFQIVFDHEGLWRRNIVWNYRLEREGLPLFDAHIDVHWENGKFAGIYDCMPGPVVRAEELEEGHDFDFWFAQAASNGARGAVELVAARNVIETTNQGVQQRLVSSSSLPLLTINLAATSGPLGGGVATPSGGHTSAGPAVPKRPRWTEFPVPSGSFPDQIASDSLGRIWFSQPNNSKITVLDPLNGSFISVAMPGDTPDGLTVDSQDRVWTGQYKPGRGIGRVHAMTGAFTNFPAPYSGDSMAIPFEASNGSIWVTDHLSNRISEFNPTTSTWLNSYVLPTGASWVVDGTEDTTTGVLYFTQYQSNSLARRAPGLAPTEIGGVIGGPAFNRYSNGKIYVSLWSIDRLAVYDIASGSVTQYAYPVAGELGGPLDTMANGRIAVGTRNIGYVMVFDPQTSAIASYKIPTSSPGLKDGLHVDVHGNIWVTESLTGNKIARLELF